MPVNTKGSYLYTEEDLAANASDMLNRRATEEAAIPWVPLILKPGYTGDAAVSIVNGVVYWRGQIAKSTGLFTQSGSEIIATLPGAQYRPPGFTRALMAGWVSATPNATLIEITGANSEVRAGSVGPSATSTVYLSSLSYRGA